MNWTNEKLAEIPSKGGFRLRGLEITRLDTFIDAAFAFDSSSAFQKKKSTINVK